MTTKIHRPEVVCLRRDALFHFYYNEGDLDVLDKLLSDRFFQLLVQDLWEYKYLYFDGGGLSYTMHSWKMTIKGRWYYFVNYIQMIPIDIDSRFY